MKIEHFVMIMKICEDIESKCKCAIDAHKKTWPDTTYLPYKTDKMNSYQVHFLRLEMNTMLPPILSYGLLSYSFN